MVVFIHCSRPAALFFGMAWLVSRGFSLISLGFSLVSHDFSPILRGFSLVLSAFAQFALFRVFSFGALFPFFSVCNEWMGSPGGSVFAELWVCGHRRGGRGKLPSLGQEPAKGEI